MHIKTLINSLHSTDEPCLQEGVFYTFNCIIVIIVIIITIVDKIIDKTHEQNTNEALKLLYECDSFIFAWTICAIVEMALLTQFFGGIFHDTLIHIILFTSITLCIKIYGKISK
jgi:hypothetical protein